MMKKKKRSSDTVFQIDNDNRGVFEFTPPTDEPKDTGPAKRREKKRAKNVGSEPGEKEAVGLRIIGGKFRGTRLQYVGDNRVRPMKDRVREAVFNLIGPTVKGRHVIDLFGGTGALTIEAMSRGAASATVVELHLPTAALLRQNLDAVGLLDLCELRKTDAFFWAKNAVEHPKAETPWLVFCSPPYDFYVNREAEILEMLGNLLRSAPPDSMFVIESDDRFNFDRLPVKPEPNRIRSYPPAEIAIFYSEHDA